MNFDSFQNQTMRKVGELMRRERGAADCRDCAILVTEVKRRGELVSIIYCCFCLFVCTLLLNVWWHFFQYLLFCLFVCVPFLSPKARGGENWFALVFFVLSIQICSASCFTIFVFLQVRDMAARIRKLEAKLTKTSGKQKRKQSI